MAFFALHQAVLLLQYLCLSVPGVTGKPVKFHAHPLMDIICGTLPYKQVSCFPPGWFILFRLFQLFQYRPVFFLQVVVREEGQPTGPGFKGYPEGFVQLFGLDRGDEQSRINRLLFFEL